MEINSDSQARLKQKTIVFLIVGKVRIWPPTFYYLMVVVVVVEKPDAFVGSILWINFILSVVRSVKEFDQKNEH